MGRQSCSPEDSEKWFEIPVVATNICDYDRSFGVEVDDKASNAIEKKQYVVCLLYTSRCV